MLRNARLIPIIALASAPLAAQEKIDTAGISAIKNEELRRSQVMEIASWLTDVYGSRLTGSPSAKAAGDWTAKKLTEWGMSNVKLESWGPFGRGWTNERMVAQVVSPRPFPIIAYAGAWTPGTSGAVKADVVLMQADSAPDLEKYRGKLRGKIVFTQPPRDSVPPHFTADASRLADSSLATLARAPFTTEPPRNPGGPNAGGPANNANRSQAAQQFQRAVAVFLADEGVVAVVTPGRGDDGTVFNAATGSRDKANPTKIPAVIFSTEHYGRIARMVEKGVPVTVELDIKNTFSDDDPSSFNIVAEIPGSDPKLKDEVVMLGAHFDSWHMGTGATDNAAGSAVMLEALRLIKATGLKPRRTIRIGLWTGEEQGLLGSRAYVKEHFGDPQTMQLKQPMHDQFAGYFNVDNGTGAIRGVYLQKNEAVAPIFKQWMAAFKDPRIGTVTANNTGGTDHLAFDAVGLPGFQFIQDPVDYGSRTHHSNMDTFERLVADDMKHNAAVVAMFVYLTANRDQKLPRKAPPTVQ
ncbi:MAG TPA: M20/M25/M40 family metallo-hydrolase [Gemmatimonadaceae bacterium]|nr:M20/M25/M40 family metallo-hydrolase [Gemmatimonadaceae bacterium]